MSELQKTMARIYVDLIKNSRKTIDEVPDDIREYVRELLKKI